MGIVEPVDGILGMARNSVPLNSDPDSEFTVGPLFVNGMVDAGIIDKNTFTFAIDQSADSQVFFGEPSGIDNISWMSA